VTGRTIKRIPCSEESPLCVEVDKNHTLCASDPLTECESDTFETTCEGDVLVECDGIDFTMPPSYPTHFVTRTDCAVAGNSCTVVEGRAGCRR
jgi:hypothetical protein